jgi:hypothetical protein
MDQGNVVDVRVARIPDKDGDVLRMDHHGQYRDDPSRVALGDKDKFAMRVDEQRS